MRDLEFQMNKKLKKKTLLLSLIGCLLGLVLFAMNYSAQKFFNMGLSIVVVICCLSVIIRSFFRENTVVVNKDGIRTRVYGMRFIPWNYIETFKVRKGIMQDFLTIELYDENEFLDTKSKAVRKVLQSNKKRLGSSFVIPQSEFLEPLEVVLAKIESYRTEL